MKIGTWDNDKDDQEVLFIIFQIKWIFLTLPARGLGSAHGKIELFILSQLDLHIN